MLNISNFNIYLTETCGMHEAGYVYSSGVPSSTSHTNILHSPFLFS